VPERNVIRHAAVRAQLDRILVAPGFAARPRLCSLLRYLVEQTLNGSAADMKEYSIGLEVFRLPESFDPKTQSIVRSSAAKLREKLAEYYQGAGRSDIIIIDIPKGAYVPRFREVGKSAPPWIWPAAAAAALVMLAMGALGWRNAVPDPHPSVAVLDVRNASGNEKDAWLSTALAEVLTENLSAAGRLRTIPTEQVADWRRGLGAPDIRAQLANHGRQLQDRLSARYAVLADFQVTGEGADPALRVSTQVLRLRDGKILVQGSDSGSETQIFSLTSRMAGRVFAALGMARDGNGIQCSGPNCESMRLYSEALLKLRAYNPLAARKLLEQSVFSDPSNFLARSTLAETYDALSMQERARVEAQAALALAPPLPPLERLALEARCQRAMSDVPSAMRSYQKLWSKSPEGIDYGLSLAELQNASGRTPQALQTVMGLRAQHPSLGDEARIDYVEALIRGMSGEIQKGLIAIRQCENESKRLGADYLYALARLREGGLLMNQIAPGRLAALEGALAICRARGYRDCQMNALRVEGNFFAVTDARRALELYGEGAVIARQLGSRGGLEHILTGMAFVASRQLLDQEAEARYREIGAIRDQDFPKPDLITEDFAELLLREGRLDEADGMLRRPGEQTLQWNLCMAQLERARGEYDAAARRIEWARADARRSDGPGDLMAVLEQSFSLRLDQGDLRRAAADLQELETARPPAVFVPYLRAELALARGNWDEAAAQAAAAQKQFLGNTDLPGTAAAALVRAEALAGGSRAMEALQALDEIAPALDRSRRAPLQIRARAIRYRAEALLHSCPDGGQVQALAESAQRLGIPMLSREISSSARQIQRNCGRAVSAMVRQTGTPVLH
jgi:TolB-like protein/tetratricopeptide (TPR) repeat protein